MFLSLYLNQKKRIAIHCKIDREENKENMIFATAKKIPKSGQPEKKKEKKNVCGASLESNLRDEVV